MTTPLRLIDVEDAGADPVTHPRRPSAEERLALRVGLSEDVAAGGLEWIQPVKRMP